MSDYERYQLQWMIDHGFSLEGLIRELNAHQHDCDPADDLLEVFWSWEHDVGFGSQIWACKQEWEDVEREEEPT